MSIELVDMLRFQLDQAKVEIARLRAEIERLEAAQVAPEAIVVRYDEGGGTTQVAGRAPAEDDSFLSPRNDR